MKTKDEIAERATAQMLDCAESDQVKIDDIPLQVGVSAEALAAHLSIFDDAFIKQCKELGIIPYE